MIEFRTWSVPFVQLFTPNTLLPVIVEFTMVKGPEPEKRIPTSPEVIVELTTVSWFP